MPRTSPIADAHRMRRLGRGIDYDLVEPVVAAGQHRAALHRRAGLPVHAVFAGDDDLGGARRRVDVAGLQRALAEDVVAPIFVHQRAAAAHRRGSVDHRVEHLEIDMTERRGPRPRPGSARRRRRSPRRHSAPCRWRAAAMAATWRPKLVDDADRLHPRQVGGGEDAALRAGRHGDAADAGMRVRAAQKHDVLRAGQPDVGDELAAAAQVPVILLAQDRRADAVFALRLFPSPASSKEKALTRRPKGTRRTRRKFSENSLCVLCVSSAASALKRFLFFSIQQREVDRVAQPAIADIARVQAVAAIVDRQHLGRDAPGRATPHRNRRRRRRRRCRGSSC